MSLTEEELRDYTIPLYFRTFEECIDEDFFNRIFLRAKLKFYQDFDEGNITIEWTTYKRRYRPVFTSILVIIQKEKPMECNSDLYQTFLDLKKLF